LCSATDVFLKQLYLHPQLSSTTVVFAEIVIKLLEQIKFLSSFVKKIVCIPCDVATSIAVDKRLNSLKNTELFYATAICALHKHIRELLELVVFLCYYFALQQFF